MTQFLSKYRWPLSISAALATTIVVNGYIYLIANTNPSLPVEKGSPYQAGLEFQESLDQLKAFSNRGWELQLRQNRELIEVEIYGASKVELQNFKATLHLMRPNQVRLDQELNLELGTTGKFYIGRPLRLNKGLWLAKLRLTSKESILLAEKQVYFE